MNDKSERNSRSRSENQSRRAFLKTSTAAAAGATIAGGLNFARTAHAAGSDQFKIALIGCGGRGTGAATQALRTKANVKLTAMAIGDIQFLRAYFNSMGVWVRPRKPGQTEMQYQVNNWYYFNWLSGDHIVEQHIHDLDICNWIKGEHPAKANGMGGRQVRIGKDFGEIFPRKA